MKPTSQDSLTSYSDNIMLQVTLLLKDFEEKIQKWYIEIAELGRVDNMLTELRERVLKTSQELYRLQMARGTSGNVSARDPESGLIAITPSGIPYEVLTTEDITIVNQHGKVVYGGQIPSSETPMHTAVYRLRLTYTESSTRTHCTPQYSRSLTKNCLLLQSLWQCSGLYLLQASGFPGHRN